MCVFNGSYVMNETRSRGENFGSHHVSMRNDNIWSDSMISDVLVNVEKWYGCLDFDIFQDADSENDIVKPDLVIDTGSPKKNL